MFSWGGFIVKLLVSLAISFGTMREQPVGMNIFYTVLLYGIISAWWFCCTLMGNYLIGSIVFIGAVAFSSWGVAAAPNMVIKVIAYIVIFGICLGGIIADIKGIIQSIRYRG